MPREAHLFEHAEKGSQSCKRNHAYRKGKTSMKQSFFSHAAHLPKWGHRIALMAALLAVVLVFSAFSFAPEMHAASANTVQIRQTHALSQVVIPLAGGNFDVSTTGARVTGQIDFTSKTTFQLNNVVLYDTKCDASSAYFYVTDLNGQFQTHQNSNGCGSSIHYATLYGSDTHGGLVWLKVVVFDNCCSNASGLYTNPWV